MSMDKLTQEDGSSMDMVKENIDKLKEIFPDVFTEGKVDFDALQSVLGDYVETSEERYSFNWHGKAQARRIAQTPSTGTLRPCPEESVDWDNTQNLFIEGDNLEVLKLLQKSYHKKVKMIYIDPPYNTGKEFIYPDKFQENLDTYLKYTGQKDAEGHKFSTNTETTGRYHTNWLNMMYPRLKLARNLLRDDGVIFVSIDDNEQANLKKVCDEIFGEENFVNNIIWQKKYAASNDAKYFSDVHDFILCYCKNKQKWKPNFLPRPKELNDKYKNPDNDPRGVWYSTNLSVKTYSKKNDYVITSPAGIEFSPPPSRCWAVSKQKYEELLADGRIWFGKDGSSRPYQKKFLTEVQQGVVPTTLWLHEEAGHTIGAKSQIRDLFSDTSALFDTPKPTKLIDRLLALTESEDKGEIVLDFFAGSCSTAHAVVLRNQSKLQEKKYIMVQLPEVNDENSEVAKAGYKTVAELSKERLRRSCSKIKEEKPDYNGDLGFKVLKLDSSNIKPWDADFEDLEGSLLGAVDNIKSERSEEDVLYEILLKYGLDLTLPIETRTIEGKKVFSIGLGALVICLDSHITLDVVEGIGKLKAELEPEVMRVVFKDNGFKDDVVKTNAIQILKRYDIEDVKSL